ncbi:MAG: prolipoprotein diacylglyceryl transferase [Gemmatimonadaceae bacterium]|nr:prolipoprotein diacylglyceryl transferase [Gemmatimonadaceae bacterium]
MGMLIGARLIYVTVYDRTLLADPISAIAIWRGGLSFHGAALGMTAACIWVARKYRIPALAVTDALGLCATPGLAFGRIGNFINGELYGRPTDVPWAMIFPSDDAALPRHPSQLYEALGEGLLLFLLTWGIERAARRGGWWRPGVGSVAFLIGYGTIRFLMPGSRCGRSWPARRRGRRRCRAARPRRAETGPPTAPAPLPRRPPAATRGRGASRIARRCIGATDAQPCSRCTSQRSRSGLASTEVVLLAHHWIANRCPTRSPLPVRRAPRPGGTISFVWRSSSAAWARGTGISKPVR